MRTSTMTYDYSTKNFHRYSGGQGTVNEVYVPRSEMAHPLTAITVSVDAAVGSSVALEKVKPAKGI